MDSAVVNPNSIKILLIDGLSTFLIKRKPVFSNGLRGLPKIPPDCTISDS